MRGSWMVVLSLATAACGNATEPVEQNGTFQQVEAGDTIRLAYGMGAALGETGARIVFRGVVVDSRCPVDVTCVWQGDAHVKLDAIQPPGGTRQIDLHTSLEPGDAQFAGYRILLLDIAPDPVSTAPIRPQDYSVRLAISRG